MEEDMLIYHINLGKRDLACDIKLPENLKGIKNAIVSTNESKSKVSRIDTLNPPIFYREPNRRTRAAVYIKGDQIKSTLVTHISSPDIAVVNIQKGRTEFVLISAYLPPDGPEVKSEYKRALDELQDAISKIKPNKKIMICSDTNSRSTLWKDRLTNNRGKALEEFIIKNNLDIVNTNGTNTFETTFTKNNEIITKSSIIDLIICNSTFYEYRPLVEVLDPKTTSTGSDHKMIKVTLEVVNENETFYKSSTRKYRTDKAD